ncbi:MAG: hypothetical protein FJ387_00080 [Verrucomicrobia bacterium]|nr:hypothetical protein [Verrucomicrobiota bacterium]
METVLYTLNTVIHLLAAVACAAAPFYQLRMVNTRARYGRAIIYNYDQSIERLLSLQPRLCVGFILVLIATGFAYPVIYRLFHGHWREVSELALATFALKTLLVFIGFGIVLYGLLKIDPKIQELFAQFKPDFQPPQALLDEFWAWRAKRKKFCKFCLGLAAAILLITPILRFY